MKIRIETVTLPAFLASALINGDTSGLEDEDLKWVEAAIRYCAPGHISSCEGEPFFVGGFGTQLPGFRLACDALNFTVLYHEES